MDRHPDTMYCHFEHHQVDVLKHLVIIMWVIAVKRWQVFWSTEIAKHYFGFARGAMTVMCHLYTNKFLYTEALRSIACGTRLHKPV